MALPLGVKLWMGFLASTNMASSFYLSQPSGGRVATLALAAFGLKTLTLLLNWGCDTTGGRGPNRYVAAASGRDRICPSGWV